MMLVEDRAIVSMCVCERECVCVGKVGIFYIDCVVVDVPQQETRKVGSNKNMKEKTGHLRIVEKEERRAQQQSPGEGRRN